LLTITEQKQELFWLRAQLGDSGAMALPMLSSLQKRILSKGCITLPHAVLSKTPPQKLPEKVAEKIPYQPLEMPAHPLDVSGEFSPFGIELAKDSIFFISSELFQNPGAEIEIDIRLRTPLDKSQCEVFEVHWEYLPAGAEWRLLGSSGVQGMLQAKSDFSDGTQAFTQSGKVKFICPDDLMPTEIAGQTGWFIRARLEKAIFKRDSKVEIKVRSVLLGYKGKPQNWPFCISENYSEIKRHSLEVPFEPFFINRPQRPAFYLSLNKRPFAKRGPYRLFLDVVENPDGPQGANIIWEYSVSEREWATLEVKRDDTAGLARAGAIHFLAKDDWFETTHFAQHKGFWLRARWEVSAVLKPPRLRRVLLNGVPVEQTTQLEKILGSSDGSPDQSLSLNASILDRPEVWVRETDDSPEDLTTALKLGRDVKERSECSQRAGKGWWVKWKEVQNFHASRVRDIDHPVRHFTVDLETGTITFGDGKYGSIPPALERDILVVYRVTQGAKGNVGKRSITVLDVPLPNVQAVKNYHAAEGGADREEIERAKIRGPWELKHRQRAVTQADFVELAEKASQVVGKAQCFEREGTVHVVIVPKDPTPEPTPSRPLLDHVTAYLTERKIIGTTLRVESPKYKRIHVVMEVALKPSFSGNFNDVEEAIKKKLNDFVHPLFGLDDRSGWEIGRTLHESELYYLIEDLPDVDWVQNLQLYESEADDKSETLPEERPDRHPEKRIEIGPDFSFPSFGRIKVKRIW
jgi:hypothetical protein